MNMEMTENQYIGYEEDIIFEVDDFDENGKLKASKLMHVFQDAAAVHATMLGYGFDVLIENNYIWVLNKLRFKVFGSVQKNYTYHLKTFPRAKKGVSYFRDYYIYDDNDQLIIAAMSNWCVINFESRRIERSAFDFTGNLITETAFKEGIPKIKFSDEGLVLIGEHIVTIDDLDENRHVNNCRYVEFVEGLIDGHRDFTINFVKETMLGETIKLYRGNDGDTIIIVGKVDDHVAFQASVE